MIKVKDSSSLARDPHSRAIINVDHDEFLNAKNAAKRAKKIDALDDEVASIKDDIAEIKQLLMNLNKG